MRVARYNFNAQFENLNLLLERIKGVLVDGRYILSEEVKQFENAFADYIGTEYARGVNTGTDALIVSLLALGVKKGDEVITQANTFNATVSAILHAGATPVLTDVNDESFLIEETQVSAAINSRTKVIIPVHLYGKPTPLKGLLKLASSHNATLVEDAAQAHGARIDGHRVGAIGAVGCFSFHPSKNLAAAGDGGAITTNSKEIDDQIQYYRNLGQKGQNNHIVIGLNSKLDAIQALVLSSKLSMLDEWNRRRRVVAKWYIERLCEQPLKFQSTSPSEEHVYHLFQIRTNQRDRLLDFLIKKEVDAVVRYPTPIHLQKAFADCSWKKGQFPVAERLADELLCLPIRQDITLDEVDYVTDSIRAFFQG